MISCLGHQHTRVLEAIAKRAPSLAYAHRAYFTSEPAKALAEKLVEHEPGALGRVSFVSGGSDAIKASVDLARQCFV